MPEVYTSYNNIVSSLGFTTKDNLSAIYQNKTGLRPVKFGKQNETFCLSVIDEDLIRQAESSIKDAQLYTKLEKLSIISIKDVLNQSGVSLSDSKSLLIYSTTKGNVDLLDGNVNTGISRERTYLPTMANTIGKYFNAANQPLVLSNACISGILAIIYAKRLIAEGLFDNIIVCGGDLITEFVVSGFKSFNALSPEPCKPFDAKRIGINLGEAVSTILITKNKNSCPSSMQIINGASANDANHISGPSRTGDGLFQAIKETMLYSSFKPDTINAHGTATPFNDEMESIAFERAGLNKVPLNSLKGYYGHTLGAAGVLETIITLEAAHDGKIIKSAGFSEIGVSGKVEIITEHKNANIKAILKTASGFGGCNAAALFAKT